MLYAIIFFYNFLILLTFILIVIYHNNLLIVKYVLVTGASSSHELSLIQFLYFTILYNSNIKIVVWDLGFSNGFKKLLSKIYKKNRNIIYQWFNFSQYPKYFDINKNKGEYAWKSIIINISFYRMKQTLLWLDAGCIVLKSLNRVYLDIEKYHVWSIFSCGNISRWTHISTIKYFNASNKVAGKKTCSGGLVGFKWNSKVSHKLLKEWVDCSFHRECIAPNGSNRMNHRQDQSALSILIYKYNLFERCPYNTYNIRTNRDINNYSKIVKLIKLLNSG